MLGAEQREWLLEELATTTARWNVLANQTAFAPFDNDFGPLRGFGGGDNWDGYVAERQMLLDWMVEKRTPNPIVITGDSHNNWVRNVPPDHVNLDAPPVATEFMGTSISTGGDEPANTRVPGAQNPHVLIRNANRGYARCTLTPDEWTTEFRVVKTVLEPDSPCSSLATFAVENGSAGAHRVGV
jgi:alkaline phosphatase D